MWRHSAWVLALTLLSMQVQAEPAGSTAGPTFTFRLRDEPETLDWNRAHTAVERYLLLNLMEGLLTVDRSLKITPALAESWSISADGRTYTFKLREGVKWSDGVPLRAQDFVFSWKRLLAPVTAASYAYFLFDIEGAEFFNKGTIQDFSAVGIRALDDHTLQVKLIRPVAHWLYVQTFWVTFPLRQDVVDKHGSGWEKPGRMVSLGPYTLMAHDFDSRVVLRRNPLYYGPRGNIAEVVGQIVRDDATALTLFEAGKFDFLTDISTFDMKRLAPRPELRTFPYMRTAYLGFAVNNYPVSNPRVRKAVAMAIDRRRVVEILHPGLVTAGGLVPPGILSHDRAIGHPFDPAGAKALLTSSGFDTTQKPLAMELVTPSWDKQMIIAQFIQSELKKNLGIEVSVQSYDNKTFRAQVDLKTHPMMLLAWGADYPDPDNILSVFQGSSGNNRTAWKSEKFDQETVRARNLMDAAQRLPIYRDLQKLLIEQESVIVPLYYEAIVALIHRRVQGLELNPLNDLFIRTVNIVGGGK